MTKIRFVMICFLFWLVIPIGRAECSIWDFFKWSNETKVEQTIEEKKPVKELNQNSGDKQIQKKNEMIKDLENEDLIISPIKSLDNEDKESAICLAMNIYNEARNSSEEDMIGVSLTVFSRLNSGEYVNSKADNTICNVIFANNQYSWTRHKIQLPKERKAWIKSQSIAHLMISDNNVLHQSKSVKYKHYVLTSLFESSTGKWFNKAHSTKIIGAHTYLLFDKDNTDKQSTMAINLISYIKGKLNRIG